MKKGYIARLIGPILVAIGCGHPTDIAKERLEDSETETETLRDTRGIDTTTAAESDADTLTDSENEPVNCEGLSSAAAGDSARTVQVGDDERSYVLHIPPAYTGSTPVPLIVDYHAIQGSGWNELSASPYRAVADDEDVVMAFPTGLNGPAGIGAAWNIGPCCVDDVDDVAFTREMIADIQDTVCIDPYRIYAVGISMGGGMVNHLACEAADIFAAVAPASFDLIEQTVDQCTPARPITVISFRGTADPLVPYSGGYSAVIPGHPITFLGAKATFEKWAEINHCTGVASDEGDGCQRFAASQCEGGVEVILCTKQGAGIIPGDPEFVWPIFERHVLY